MDWVSHLGTFLAGLVAGYTLKVVINNRSTNKRSINVVSQKGNFAGRDIVGGNNTKDNSKK